ncbi:MAG: acryloyl-CoA reductase [Gammaproteobacteria bacterium]|nr:MAG: acryloyl-CoA reductase [Gammaproteobacteria bacterium]|tara:strand:- start:3409 stop:4392 length:984 start_codon:yes stop_codon:yes gene_type:complete
MEFKALVSSEVDKKYKAEVQTRTIQDLPEGDVLIRVNFSSLNYKDALSAIGNKGVSRNYPHTPGIDAAGIIESSESNNFKAGEEVIVTGYDLGMNTSGGFSEYIRVPSEWVVKKPEDISLSESMALGTAGLTAGLCVRKLLNHKLTPDSGKLFVTGATGGVGIVAMMLLSKLGFEVVAITGKLESQNMLKKYGASEVITREDLDQPLISPLQKSIYAGGVDAVGGNVLSNLLCATSQRAAIACCGMVNGADLNTSVFPFILRGVSLYGVDSAETEIEVKKEVWNNFSSAWKLVDLENEIKEITLSDLPTEIDTILKGQQIGRIRIKI